jgi:indole-3-glycerol phosphate synthase
MTFLEEILKLKRRRIEKSKSQIDFDELKTKAQEIRKQAKHFALSSALKNFDKTHIIAEIKRASPSKGLINDKINVEEVARAYERGGATAISVLTEEDRFKGSLEDLKKVRAAIFLPILRKDFVFDEFQIYEAAAAGADVVLLIVAMLDDVILQHLRALIEDELKMDALVEVHTLSELERAKSIGAKLIGVNNRDLHSFKVSLDVSRSLINHAPLDALMIAESGLKTRKDLQELKNLGFRAFLIGETLMKSENVERDLQVLIN